MDGGDDQFEKEQDSLPEVADITEVMITEVMNELELEVPSVTPDTSSSAQSDTPDKELILGSRYQQPHG